MFSLDHYVTVTIWLTLTILNHYSEATSMYPGVTGSFSVVFSLGDHVMKKYNWLEKKTYFNIADDILSIIKYFFVMNFFCKATTMGTPVE